MARRRKFTKSEQMARVRRTETAPEMALRRALWQRGVRYRLRPRLPGSPDLVFAATRVAVFVDGCFWHGCPEHYTAPLTNADFWRTKMQTNRARDLRVEEELRALGWRSMRIWEHDIRVDVDGVVLRIVEEKRRPPEPLSQVPTGGAAGEGQS